MNEHTQIFLEVVEWNPVVMKQHKILELTKNYKNQRLSKVIIMNTAPPLSIDTFSFDKTKLLDEQIL